MAPVFKNKITGLSHSRVPKKRILVGIDTATNSLIWSDAFPYFYTTADDDGEEIPFSTLSKPSVRLQPPFDAIKFAAEVDCKNALRMFRRIWRVVFPEVAQSHSSGPGCVFTITGADDESVSAKDFVHRVRKAGEKLHAPFDRLDLDTDEDVEHAVLVFEDAWMAVFQRHREMERASKAAVAAVSKIKESLRASQEAIASRVEEFE